MKKMKFNEAQKSYIAENIDAWYLAWKDRICLNSTQPHHLGQAKEQLKNLLLPIEDKE